MKKPTWSRREFLEASAAAAGVSLAAQPFKFRALAPSDTVRFGMVGVGMQGSGLLGTSIQLPGVTCAGAADLYDGRHTLAKEIVRPDLPRRESIAGWSTTRQSIASLPRSPITGTGGWSSRP